MSDLAKIKKLQIAILGWGSLIWDERPEFDKYHSKWLLDGPVLPLEFSRVSESRKGALTLVIDSVNGSDCQVAYTLSARSSAEDAIADLRCREGTTMERMGFYFGNKTKKCAVAVPASIAPWAAKNSFDVVIWTGLSSNFEREIGKKFSVERAITHLQNLTPEAKAGAAAYIWRAPEFIKTKLRSALQVEPWFVPISAPKNARA